MSKFHVFTSPENFAVIINVKKISAILETADGKSNVILDNGRSFLVDEGTHSIKVKLEGEK